MALMPPTLASTAPADLNVQRFGFLLLPNFSLIALSSAVDPLRLANMALGQRVFDYVTLGVSAEPVLSSDGIRVLPDQVMGESDRFDTVFVIGPNPIPKQGYADITRWLRRLAAQGFLQLGPQGLRQLAGALALGIRVGR